MTADGNLSIQLGFDDFSIGAILVVKGIEVIIKVVQKSLIPSPGLAQEISLELVQNPVVLFITVVLELESQAVLSFNLGLMKNNGRTAFSAYDCPPMDTSKTWASASNVGSESKRTNSRLVLSSAKGCSFGPSHCGRGMLAVVMRFFGPNCPFLGGMPVGSNRWDQMGTGLALFEF